MYRNYLFFSDLAAKFIVGRIIWLKPDSDVNELKYALTYGYNMAGALMWHYKIFCVNVKYRIQNRVLYFLFYIFTPKE